MQILLLLLLIELILQDCDLVSDTGSPVGGTSALRGWDINKNGTSAELSFSYQNSDAIGQAVDFTIYRNAT